MLGDPSDDVGDTGDGDLADGGEDGEGDIGTLGEGDWTGKLNPSRALAARAWLMLLIVSRIYFGNFNSIDFQIFFTILLIFCFRNHNC